MGPRIIAISACIAVPALAAVTTVASPFDPLAGDAVMAPPSVSSHREPSPVLFGQESWSPLLGTAIVFDDVSLIREIHGPQFAQPPVHLRARGMVRVGAVMVDGHPHTRAQAVASAAADRMRGCYGRELGELPDMRGSLTITAVIDAGGNVRSASARGGSGLSGALVGCAQALVASAAFALPGGARVQIPLTFAPGPAPPRR